MLLGRVARGDAEGAQTATTAGAVIGESACSAVRRCRRTQASDWVATLVVAFSSEFWRRELGSGDLGSTVDRI